MGPAKVPMSSRINRFLHKGHFLAVLASTLFLACSNDHTGPGRVSGKVSFAGQSFENWEIRLVTIDTGSGTSGLLDADGYFTLKDRIDPEKTYAVYSRLRNLSEWTCRHPSPTRRSRKNTRTTRLLVSSWRSSRARTRLIST